MQTEEEIASSAQSSQWEISKLESIKQLVNKVTHFEHTVCDILSSLDRNFRNSLDHLTIDYRLLQ